MQGCRDMCGKCNCPSRYCKCDKAVSNSALSDGLEGQHDYAYKTIEEFEEIVGQKVMNDSFKMGWDMARVTISQLRQLVGEKKAY